MKHSSSIIEIVERYESVLNDWRIHADLAPLRIACEIDQAHGVRHTVSPDKLVPLREYYGQFAIELLRRSNELQVINIALGELFGVAQMIGLTSKKGTFSDLPREVREYLISIEGELLRQQTHDQELVTYLGMSSAPDRYDPEVLFCDILRMQPSDSALRYLFKQALMKRVSSQMYPENWKIVTRLEQVFKEPVKQLVDEFRLCAWSRDRVLLRAVRTFSLERLVEFVQVILTTALCNTLAYPNLRGGYVFTEQASDHKMQREIPELVRKLLTRYSIDELNVHIPRLIKELRAYHEALIERSSRRSWGGSLFTPELSEASAVDVFIKRFLYVVFAHYVARNRFPMWLHGKDHELYREVVREEERDAQRRAITPTVRFGRNVTPAQCMLVYESLNIAIAPDLREYEDLLSNWLRVSRSKFFDAVRGGAPEREMMQCAHMLSLVMQVVDQQCQYRAAKLAQERHHEVTALLKQIHGEMVRLRQDVQSGFDRLEDTVRSVGQAQINAQYLIGYALHRDLVSVRNEIVSLRNNAQLALPLVSLFALM